MVVTSKICTKMLASEMVSWNCASSVNNPGRARHALATVQAQLAAVMISASISRVRGPMYRLAMVSCPCEEDARHVFRPGCIIILCFDATVSLEGSDWHVHAMHHI
jgi:hypothetical protein